MKTKIQIKSTLSKDVLTAAMDDAILVVQNAPKLVLPRQKEQKHDYESGWNECIQMIKYLNPHITDPGYTDPK